MQLSIPHPFQQYQKKECKKFIIVKLQQIFDNSLLMFQDTFMSQDHVHIREFCRTCKHIQNEIWKVTWAKCNFLMIANYNNKTLS